MRWSQGISGSRTGCALQISVTIRGQDGGFGPFSQGSGNLRMDKARQPCCAVGTALAAPGRIRTSDPQIRNLKARNQRAGAAAVCRFVWAGLIANVIKTSGPRAAHKGRTYGPTAPV